MVNDMQAKRRIVIVGGGSALGQRLCEIHANNVDDVIAVDLAEGSLEDIAAACGAAPIDLLVFADDADLPDAIGTATRQAMQEALYRLTFAPFRLATLLRPAVAAAGGSVVLYSRTSAMMKREAAEGHFADRPFRAAAHALWKCLEVEWREDDIRLQIIVLRDPGSPSRLVEERNGVRRSSPLLIDEDGRERSW
jgi:NAD(P)-dependent dehydrogenase (short-subunit alcohol dehydrogenase family)